MPAQCGHLHFRGEESCRPVAAARPATIPAPGDVGNWGEVAHGVILQMQSDFTTSAVGYPGVFAL